MSQQIDRETLDQILQSEDIDALSFPGLVELFQGEDGIADFLPDGVCQTDPRNEDRVLFNSSRARRPRDNQRGAFDDTTAPQECVVCQGLTTGVIDVAALSEGFTFINKNLYPSLYPFEANQPKLLKGQADQPATWQMPYGLHFLQWTSSLHDKDWHNMPLEDRVVVMRRLAVLERKLLTDGKEFLLSLEPWTARLPVQSFVLIIKNYGHLVGGSIAHGHQQIALSNIIPRRLQDNMRFERKYGTKFSTYMLWENPAEFCVRDYGRAVLLVPYFMRRPYDMMLLLKDDSKQYLYQLDREETQAVAEGWHDALRAIRWIMPEIGKDIAYNVITHNGPGAGLYFEFLPYTQETGGFEHLGLYVCQGNPKSAAGRIRESLTL